ncbi:MAG: hypothetical protein QOI95_374 [Acidimicrobiaceae bacterium]
MIHLVDQALEKYLRAAVPMPEAAIDVSFAAPDRTWGSGITRPSVNIYLWDIKRSAPRAQAGQIEMTEDGQVFRRPPFPVVHLTYFVTAWAKELRDEHQLLGSVLRAVLSRAEVPEEHIPDDFKKLSPILLEIASSEQRKPGDFSSTLDGQLKPGLEVRVTIEVDAFGWEKAGPPTEGIEYGLNRLPERRTPPAKTLGDMPRPTRTRRSGSVVVEGRREPLNGDDAPAKA